MNGKTVTDKRIDVERKKVSNSCDALYEATFYRGSLGDGPPDNQFWHDEAALDDDLAKKLKSRPMSTMDVRIAFNGYIVAFKVLCKKHGQQAGVADKAHG